MACKQNHLKTNTALIWLYINTIYPSISSKDTDQQFYYYLLNEAEILDKKD